jgi:hypothetical protein
MEFFLGFLIGGVVLAAGVAFVVLLVLAESMKH